MISILVSTVTLTLAQAALLVEAGASPALADTAVEEKQLVVAQAEATDSAAITENVVTDALPDTPAASVDEGVLATTVLPAEEAVEIVKPNFRPAFAELSDEEVVQKVTDYLEELTTLQGEFIQTAPSGAVATGQIYIRRPGQARFDYDDPSPLTIVATQGQVYVQDDALDQTDSYPLKKTPLKFLLSKRIDLSDARLVAVDRWEDAIAVTYASTDEETEGELTLALAAPELEIAQWAVRDVQNGLTIVELANVESGAKIGNRLFRVPEAGGAFIKN